MDGHSTGAKPIRRLDLPNFIVVSLFSIVVPKTRRRDNKKRSGPTKTLLAWSLQKTDKNPNPNNLLKIMKNKTVFIVDSDPSSAHRLRLHLEVLKFNVTCFGTGSEMMDHIASTPSLIVLASDLRENNNGLEYLRQIKEINRTIPVLFLLSQNNLSMAVHALRLGAAFYLEKINTSFESIKNVLYHLDIEKKRKYWNALRSLRQGVFSLYGIY